MAKRWDCMTSKELWPLLQHECERMGFGLLWGFSYAYNLNRASRLSDLHEAARSREFEARRKAREGANMMKRDVRRVRWLRERLVKYLFVDMRWLTYACHNEEQAFTQLKARTGIDKSRILEIHKGVGRDPYEDVCIVYRASRMHAK